MARVVVGSLLQARGRPRIVRAVQRSRRGALMTVTCAIRHCSWTGRAYTVLTAGDLQQQGYRLLPVPPRPLRADVDQLMALAIDDVHRRPYPVTCCEVAAWGID